MFIRRAKTRTTEDGTEYFSYRLVRNERQGDKVRQRTLLNLGSNFPVEKRHWRLLCARITQLIGRQETLLPLPWPDEVEAEAQRIAARLVSRSPPVAGAGTGPTMETVDVTSLEMVRPRSAGVEHVGLWAMEQLGLAEFLEHLGFNRRSRAVAMGSIIGRMAVPGSERATWRWLCERSALGELLDVDFETMSMMRLYRASDALLSRRRAIEAHVFERVTDLFSLGHTVTLFDLTNTFFEGAVDKQPKARRGHSKEKRSDCPLLTLGLVLDGSGFVQRSEVFPGNVKEDSTLEGMLARLSAPRDALVVMDAGIATEDNVTWLRDNGYRYLVVSRERVRHFDPDLATAIETRTRGKVHIQAVTDEEASELRLFCCSEARAEKEQGITERFMTRFEDELQKLHDGLSRPRTRKQVAYVWQRIGRIRQKSRGAGQHYSVDIVTDPENAEKAVGAHLDADTARRHHAHPSRRLLPAHQPARLGCGDPVADVLHADGCGIGVPVAQVGTGSASRVSLEAGPVRWSPVHQRPGLPAGPGHSQPPSGSRRDGELENAAGHSFGPDPGSPPVSVVPTDGSSTSAGRPGRSPGNGRSIGHSVLIPSPARRGG